MTSSCPPHVPFWNEISTDLHKGPFLGLDWGKKWTGIALSDCQGEVAMPLKIVPTGGAVRHVLVDLWKDHCVQALVIGWPLHLNSHPNVLCPTILRLAQRLIEGHGWSVALWDERLSSQGACASMPSGRFSREKRIDDHAAAFILQGALNQRKIAQWDFFNED